jgi:hypothetical protein
MICDILKYFGFLHLGTGRAEVKGRGVIPIVEEKMLSDYDKAYGMTWVSYVINKSITFYCVLSLICPSRLSHKRKGSVCFF